jgi:hypothetical protein
MNIKTRLLKLEEQQAAKKVTRKPSKEWLAALINIQHRTTIKID